MKKSLILLAVLFLTVGVVAQKETKASQKAQRWQGHIIRINKTDSTLDVRGGQKNMDATDKRIKFDDSTKWTKLGKSADQADFKDGAYVIVAGTVDEKGVMHASQIDLRQR